MMKNIKTYFFLHILLMVYSMETICSKLAGQQEFLSLKFCLFYGGIIALMGVYAIGWQQVIKRMPLTAAFANKAITVVWGLVWGALFFNEEITIKKLVGAAIVIAGVVLYSLNDNYEEEEGKD